MLNEKEIQRLRGLTNFPAIVGYLRDELDWPIEAENIEEITFDYEPDELGVDTKHAVKINRIRQLRDLAEGQPWGIFYVDFESKRMPVMVLRRILQALVRANEARRAWALDDLLFICVQGEPGERSVAFAHFRKASEVRSNELQTFSWDSRESHFYYLVNLNLQQLQWPQDERNISQWREQWRAAFTSGHRETITESKRMASAMAEHARTIRELVEDIFAVEATSGPLHTLLERFRIDLLHDLTPDSFADMIAQTITYGLFAAAEQNNDLNYSHIVEAIPNTNPFLKELLASLINEGQIDLAELGVDRLVELLREAKITQITHDFMRQSGSGQEDPVVHFYEQFLNEYDRKQRVERGVFYTPDPVVSYIVRSVDALLESEFGLEDGLASDAINPVTGEHLVQILDPATGTGTFLAHIIDLIAQRKNAGNTPDWNKYVSEHLLPRLNGFELMMAPYTIAHMKLGLKLKQTGYNFESNERLHVYLTNALEKAIDTGNTLALTGFLSQESSEAAEVKNKKQITVVIGNPPYSGESANDSPWINNLMRGKDENGKSVASYFEIDGQGLNERNPKWINNDYVKFIRFAQWRIELTGAGILAFITDNSYVDSPTFRGMRQQLTLAFDDIYILNLHGYYRRPKSPGGEVDKNVFDIQQGVAIILGIKRYHEPKEKKICVADLWGSREYKYESLRSYDISKMQNEAELQWQAITPQRPNYFFKVQNLDFSDEYQLGIKVTEIFPENNMGVTSGDDNRFVAFDVRDLHVENMLPKYIKLIAHRPFDTKWIYYDTNLLARARKDLMFHLEQDNLALSTLRRPRNDLVGNFWVTRGITDKSIISSADNAQVLPLYIYPVSDTLFETFPFPLSDRDRYPNLATACVADMECKLNLKFITDGRGDLIHTFGPEDIFHYAYAVFHSPKYRDRYVEFLKIDFPRLPLTDDPLLFLKLVQKGADLVALHLLEEDYGAASWNLEQEDSPFVDPSVRFVPGVDGTTVGKFGSKESNYDEGKVYLDSSKNGSYFENVPKEVWDFKVGGYQVCHKWLYDRRAVTNQPGRTLSEEDILHYMYIVASLRETIVVMKEIDTIIESHGGWPLRGSQPADENTKDEETETMQTPFPLEADEDKQQNVELTADLVDRKLSEESGVEYEGDDPQPTTESNLQPFDPTLIRIDTRPITVDGIIKRIVNDEINLHPDFQRMGGIWNDMVQSRLIESLLIRIPLPAFYMDATDDDKWLVIDGLQRLTALKRFIVDKSLKLQKLEFWGNEYNGKIFDELPRALQRRIEETQLTLYLVQKGTPHKVKFNIFKRINTGGVPLSGQEIRHALNLGRSTELLEELAKSHEFKRATDESVSPMRMVDRECVLRFLAFKLKDPKEYSSRDDLDSFLNDRMQEINIQGKQRPAFLDELRDSFKRAMNAAHDIFGNRAFRKIDKGTGRRSPISKALFEAWSVNLDKLNDAEIKKLVESKVVLEKKFLALLNDPEFGIAISYSTGDARRVKYRFEQVEQIIQETLNA